MTAYTQPLQPFLHAWHYRKHFLFYISLKKMNFYYLLRYYVHSIVLCTTDVISTILQSNSSKRQVLWLFYKRWNTREKWSNLLKVTKLGSAIAAIHPAWAKTRAGWQEVDPGWGPLGLHQNIRVERRWEAPFQVVQTLLQKEVWEARKDHIKQDMATVHPTSK